MPKRSVCPKNRNWLSPYITVHDAQKAMDFYVNVFGFKKKEILREATSNRILYAIISYNDFDIMMGPDVAFSGRSGSLPPYLTQTHSPVIFYVYVDDVDLMYENLVNSGIEIINPIQDVFWGDRMFKCVDPEGYYWDFATRIASPDVNKAPLDLYFEDIGEDTVKPKKTTKSKKSTKPKESTKSKTTKGKTKSKS